MKSFTETVKGALVGSDTKNVVNAASEGNDEKYEKAVNSYSWPHTRDYTVVLLIFSPLVCAMQIVDNMQENDESDDTVKKFEKLAPLVDSVLIHEYMLDLCKYIGEGNGEEIKETLKKFSTYKDLLKALGINGDVITKLIDRSGDITPWGMINRRYIKGKLNIFIRGELSAKLANKITQGLDLPMQYAGRKLEQVIAIPEWTGRPADPQEAEGQSVRPFYVRSKKDYGVGENSSKRYRLTDGLRGRLLKFGVRVPKSKIYIDTYELKYNIIVKYIDSNQRHISYEILCALHDICSKIIPGFANGCGNSEPEPIERALYVKCVIDNIADYDKTKKINLDEFDKKIKNLYVTNQKILEKANADYMKFYKKYSSPNKNRPIYYRKLERDEAKWEKVTDLSQIPDNNDFQVVTFDCDGSVGWPSLSAENLVAIAKITNSKNSEVKIFFVPCKVEDYHVLGHVYSKGPKLLLDFITKFINSLDSGKQLIEDTDLIKEQFSKEKINVVKDPKAFLVSIKKQLEEKKN